MTPAQNRSLDEVRAFADETARIYGLPQIHVLVSHNPDSPVGSYRRGFFAVNELVLRSEFRDAIVAHELAHYVLGHDAALTGATPEARLLERQQRELDANAKSVEILTRVRGVPGGPGPAHGLQLPAQRPPPAAALARRRPARPPAPLRGDRRPAGPLPAQLTWTCGLECAPRRAAVAG